jgi:hypothetical protein
MSKRMDKAVYERLLEAYRLKPGNASHARRIAKTGEITASRAWSKGWPDQELPPIRTVIEEERIKARSMLEAERLARTASEKKTREDASKNALETRKQEGQMATFSRGAATHALTASVELARGARALGTTIAKRVTLEKDKVEAWIVYETAIMNGQTPPAPTLVRPPLNVDQLVQLLNRVADYMVKINQSARQAMELERLHLGQPTDIVGLVDASLQEMTTEELDVRVHAALQAIEGAKKVGGLSVISGGQSTPVIGRRVYVR